MDGGITNQPHERPGGLKCDAKSKRTHQRCGANAVTGSTKCYHHGGRGSGAPKGNENAVTHGAYRSLVLDALDPDEQVAFQAMPVSPKSALEETLRITTIREARLMKRIAELRRRESEGSNRDQLHVVEETDEEGGTGEDGSAEGKTKTKRRSLAESILTCEDALTRIQGIKARCADSLHRLEQDGKGDPDDEGAKTLADAILQSAAMLTGGTFERVVPPSQRKKAEPQEGV